ncbi:MAG TPA: hypothetical protein PKY50_06160 [Candidatus Competibacter sp.]|nr:hypothetical protein [Candidatus Competibacter sp.]
MPVLASEAKIYRSITNDDTASNGGRMSATALPSGITNYAWPAVDPALAVAGATRYRKHFLKIDNADDLQVGNARIGLLKPAPGDIRLHLLAGTQTDVQSGVGSTLYGCGKLDADVSAGASSIAVLVEKGTDIVFRDGDAICITDRATVNGAGNLEFHAVSGTPSVAGDVVTVPLAGTLANGYSAATAYATSLLPLGTIQAAVGAPSIASAAGTFDEGAMTCHAIGGLYQNWTLTFSSATAFSCTGDTIGSVGSGNINSVFAPNNAAFGSPYFSVLAAAWGGTFQTGDTVQVQTTPASAGFWERLLVPAGASDLQGHTRKLLIFFDG